MQTILQDEEYEDMECVVCGFTRTYLEKAIAELEVKAHPKTCGNCKYWHEKSCMNNDGIAYCAPNAVYEDDYCKDYEAIQ